MATYVLLVVNELLKELEERVCLANEVIAYAHDVALLVKEKFLNTVYDHTQGYLNVVTKWADRSRVAINLNKTELVLFTKRYKIPDVFLLLLGASSLQRETILEV